MKRILRVLSRAGCLTSLLAPILGVILYPKANWLFAFLLLGIVIVVVEVITRKQPTPTEVADRAEHLLDGSDGGYGSWAVDDYEHLNPKSEPLKDLWRRTMSIGGLPEEWTRSDDETRARMLEVIAEIRRLGSTESNHGT
jgi:hypothetical protein